MNKKLLTTAVISISMGLSNFVFAQDVVHPSKITKDDIAGNIFDSPSMITTHNGGSTQLDVRTLLSTDKKFDTGMYKSGPTRFEINEPYGVDEFMYF